MTLWVRDCMHRGVVTCELDATLAQAAARLANARETAIVVVDRVGEVAGLISRTDLARAFVSGQLDKRAEDIMTTDVATIVPDIPVQAAVQLMLDRRIHQLVILHARPAIGRPVGMLSLDDIVRLISEHT